MPQWDPARLDRTNYLDPGINLPVFYGDLDTNGHINNVAMGRYMEMGRLALHREHGLDRMIRGSGGNQLIARVAIDYLAEAHFGELDIRTRIASVGRTSAVEQQAAFQHDTCVALCEAVVVRLHDGKPVPWSEQERAVYESLQA